MAWIRDQRKCRMIMPRPREEPDGSLIYPRRGDPPPLKEGFYRDPGNQFILRPNMPECEFRREGSRGCDTCSTSPTTFFTCTKGYEVSPRLCDACIKSGKRDRPMEITPVRLE
jgi:hypothetical protein